MPPRADRAYPYGSKIPIAPIRMRADVDLRDGWFGPQACMGLEDVGRFLPLGSLSLGRVVLKR